MIASRLARRAALALVLLSPGAAARAQGDALDSTRLALTWHKLTREPIDLRAVAERSDAVRRVSQFDHRDAVAAEATRLQSQLDAADPSHEFVVRVSDQISQYDHDKGEFSIGLFQPGSYLPIRAFGEEYRVAFANAERARVIAMPKEEARVFDARLDQAGRQVTDEVRFRVTGKGDPAGGVTGPHVVRAELLAVRVMDRSGTVLYTPDLAARSGAVAAIGPPAFDAARADVAGFRVGVKVKDLEATLTRLFGPVERGSAGEHAHPGLAGSLTVNSMGCFSIPGRRQNPEPGAVCVTALFDRDEIVRAIRVERLFPWFDSELFRATLVRRYGPVAGADSRVNFSLGWGPEVDPALLYDRAGPHTALAAYYTADDDYLSRGSNSLPRIKVVLQLVDAAWAAAAAH